eukprot:TRINITY_DN2250_c0_g1_i4.p2 TRINITY_DN2250_c0_g1~~TRINITY_DN2250_c0_g1_i4.p2  ORF type:complete len:185 (+),score=50.59 TRINITY_DN2250_c0_g1_i4:67-621(+)
MNVDGKAIALAVVALIVWIFQVVALAAKDAILDADRGWCDAGLFNSECGGDGLVDSRCDDVADHAKAAAAFGVLAVLIMSLTMIVHILMAIPPAKGKVAGPLSPLLNFMFAVHFVCALFLMITWCVLAGMFDRKFCGGKLKNSSNLSYGFAFFIINFIAEIVMGVLCMMGWHGGSSAKSTQDPF